MKILILEDGLRTLMAIKEQLDALGFTSDEPAEPLEFAKRVEHQNVWVRCGEVEILVCASVAAAMEAHETSPFEEIFLDRNLIDGRSDEFGALAVSNDKVKRIYLTSSDQDLQLDMIEYAVKQLGGLVDECNNDERVVPLGKNTTAIGWAIKMLIAPR